MAQFLRWSPGKHYFHLEVLSATRERHSQAPWGWENSTWQDGQSGKEAFLQEASLHGPPGIWGTWSQFLEVPSSSYLTAITVGILGSGGIGAEVR